MNKLKELRNKVKKNNKGFSLVELIVVIVILAILIGVTIGGIYKYVNESRKNTDINNAASIQSSLSTLSTDMDFTKDIEGTDGADNSIKVQWVKSIPGSTTSDIGQLKADAVKKVMEICTDGLPESKTGDGFTLTFTYKKATKDVSITCKAECDGGTKVTSPTLSGSTDK